MGKKENNKKVTKKIVLSRKAQYLLMSIIPIYFMIAGMIMQPIKSIGEGLATIVLEPAYLITDYVELAGIGAAFMNAGLVALISIVILYVIGKELDGHSITSVCLMFGFALFGKNIGNIWSILLGVFLYDLLHGEKISRNIYVAFYGTCLSPFVSQMMEVVHIPLLGRIALATLIGMLIGFVLPAVSAYVRGAHNGYTIYNVGFAAGITGVVVFSVLKYFGLKVESRLIWSETSTDAFAVLLFIMFVCMLAVSFFPDPKHTWEGYIKILKSSGKGGTDYLRRDGIHPVLLNMAVNGIFSTCFVVLTGGDLNGPSVGAIFTVMGFSATGKNLKNITPVMMGVWFASLAGVWNITDPSAVLALLLSTTLAPIAGEFGPLVGVIAGILHSFVALNVGVVYSGMNLYNNGFAGGLVAIFLAPILHFTQELKRTFRNNRRRKRKMQARG